MVKTASNDCPSDDDMSMSTVSFNVSSSLFSKLTKLLHKLGEIYDGPVFCHFKLVILYVSVDVFCLQFDPLQHARLKTFNMHRVVAILMNVAGTRHSDLSRPMTTATTKRSISHTLRLQA